MKWFSTHEEKFVSLRGQIISSIYSSSKLKTKLEVISRYHEVVRSQVTDLPAQSCPETRASFSYPELPWVAVAQSANPLTQPSPWAFSLDPLSARSLGKSGRVSLGDVTAHGRVQD